MGTPAPKYPLENHCSIVHDNTLYVYSPQGFQSLKLQEGAKWKTLPMDISLTGAQCVKAAPAGDAKAAQLYIVGGAVNETAATWNYPGMMHYTFATKKWDWLRAESWNTANRQNHAATYLQESRKILVYAGSQDTGEIGPSTQSFLFSTQSPYAVQSLPSAGAPPTVKPMLMAADSKTAYLVGGGASNTAIWKFDEAQGWRNTGTTLQQPIANQEAVQCAMVTGKDGSVVLEKFDMSVTPNKVERLLIMNKDGTPAAPGATVAADKVKRVEVSDWSKYNATYAPTSTRSGYSLAQGNDGLTVASGGNQTDPLVLFDAQANSWLNATEVFNGQNVLIQSESSSTISSSITSATVSASATPSSTDVPAVASPPSNKGKMLTVLGATLGTIFGIAAVLILILFCLKYRKNKSQKSQGYAEKDRMSFADRGAEFMKEAGGSVIAQPYQQNNDSVTSLAIIQGRPGNHKKNQASDASTAGLVKKSSPLGYSDPVELSKFDLKPEGLKPETLRMDAMVRQNSGRTPPVKSAPRARSSGWSRYFANNEATNLANVQPDRSTYASDRTSIASVSQYTNSRMYSRHPSQHIAPLAPLQIPQTQFDGQRLSRVASGSPTLGTPTSILPHQVQPMQAELSRANSNGSTRSGVSGHNDHYYQQPVETWTPVGEDQRASSTYTGSMVIDPNSKYDVASSYYPDGTDSFYPKSNFSSFYPGQGEHSPVIPDARDSTFTMFPTGNASSAPPPSEPKSKFSSMYPAPPRLGLAQDRDSSATLFPGGSGPPQRPPRPEHDAMPSPTYNSFYPPPRVGHESTVTMFPGPNHNQDASKKEDMSWLNLGR
ncbi:hypothetical protein NX059_006782 [Plenodomus lindquistii]|nr:hypothetical protein NX059_006782 [Plenodomus lindquistii]